MDFPTTFECLPQLKETSYVTHNSLARKTIFFSHPKHLYGKLELTVLRYQMGLTTDWIIVRGRWFIHFSTLLKSIPRILEFRSMNQASDKRREHPKNHRQEKLANPKLFKYPESGITKVGKIIRKYLIDESPQILNVLEGEMSLFGLRSPLQSEFRENQKQVRPRLFVKPGIIGNSKVSGWSLLSGARNFRLDLHYGPNRQIVQDTVFISKNFFEIIKPKSAS